MRWLCLSGLAWLTACGAPEVQSQRLKDGSWSFTCELSMDECLRRVQDKCQLERFRIIEATSETRLRDAPPFERAYHTSRLHLMCTDDGANPLVTLGGKSEPVKAAAAPANICTTGETRACVGVGACKGGQSCLPDGAGFGACDCGPIPPAAPSVESTPAATPGAPSTSGPSAPPSSSP